MYNLNDPEFVAMLVARGVGMAPPSGLPQQPTPPTPVVAQPPAWAGQRSAKKGTIGNVPKYPWRTMPVNGTFQIPPGPDQPAYRGMQSTCWTKGKLLDRTFRVHQYPDGTIEVWRQR